MAKLLTAGMPPLLDLDGGWTIRVTAVDATTGATVTGVKVSNVMIMALAVGAGTLSSGDFAPLPLLVPSEG